VLIDMHGEIWVSTAENVAQGIAADGSRLSYSAGHGEEGPQEGEADFDPSRGRDIPMKAVDPTVFAGLLRRVRQLAPRHDPYWQDAKLARADDGTLVWRFEYITAEFRARADGSGLCRNSPHDNCRGALDDVL
jgi:hypothetical protein